MFSTYKFALLEIRPRIRSINAYITLHQNCLVDVTLEKDAIFVKIDNDTKKIDCKDLNIMENSLMSLNVDEKFVTFRCTTDSSDSEFMGGFRTEFLQHTVASIESLSNKPKIKKECCYTIQCLNCGRALSEAKRFERVLPLPSEGSSMSDWFCHGHSHENCISLDPKQTDIFYTHCFVHVNSDNIVNVKGNQKVLVCKSCLSWLGVRHNPNTVKLWLNTVKFSASDSYISTTSLSDVFNTIKWTLKNSQQSSVRLIASCQTTSSQVDNLLLWILEKKLQILFDNSKEIRTYDVAKALFKFEKSDENKTVLQWQNDPMVQVVNISKPMMLSLITHLHKFHKILPEAFSKSNDFKISYLFLYNAFVE